MQKISSSLLNMTINILFFYIPTYGLVVKASVWVQYFQQGAKTLYISSAILHGIEPVCA